MTGGTVWGLVGSEGKGYVYVYCYWRRRDNGNMGLLFLFFSELERKCGSPLVMVMQRELAERDLGLPRRSFRAPSQRELGVYFPSTS
jgi:hypothetical protein